MHNKKQLLPLVMREAKALRKAMTEQEIGNLDLESLNPDSFTSCIYGQATGDCRSKRAVSLIRKCCTRVFNAGENEDNLIGTATLNGSPIGKRRTKKAWLEDSLNFFSPIEVMIFEKGNKRNTKNLVNFLKGNTKTLTLS